MLRANVASYTLTPLSSGQMSASESSSVLICTHCQCPPGLEGVPSDSASLPRCLSTWQAREVEKYWLVNATPFRGCLLLVNIPLLLGTLNPLSKWWSALGRGWKRKCTPQVHLVPYWGRYFWQVAEIGIGEDRGASGLQISLFSCQTLCFFVHQDVTNIKYPPPCLPPPWHMYSL